MSIGVASLVLFAALLHASWNAMLRSGRDRFWAAAVMAFAGGVAGLIAVFFLPLPARASWVCIFISAVVHIAYQLLLVRMYRQGDFGHTYPIARGSSPLLIALGGFLMASERLHGATVAGIILVSLGILILAFGGEVHAQHVSAALATGASIAIYSVTDGLGVRLSGNAISYTAWMVIGYGLPMPLIFLFLRRKQNGRFFQGPPREFARAAGGGVLSIVGYGIVIWAMEHAPMGPVSALRETSVLFAVLLGCVYLREPFTWRKAVSSVLIVSGAICLNVTK
jgi:drug/metabolite transporter (DMT)-like permease